MPAHLPSLSTPSPAPCDAVEAAIEQLAHCTDVELVMQWLRQQCAEEQCPGVVLVHMLYARLTNKTIVDQEVEALRQRGTYKVLHLAGALQVGTTVGLISTATYVQDLRVAFPRDDTGAAVAFENWICESTAISATNTTLGAAGLSDSHLAVLQHAGFLRPRPAGEEGGMWVAHPSLGRLLQQLRAGQQAVVTALQRTRFRELPESKLLALFRRTGPDDDSGPARKKPRPEAPLVTDLFAIRGPADGRGAGGRAAAQSSLPAPYHILDLLGRQVVQTVPRPRGDLVYRLPTAATR